MLIKEDANWSREMCLQWESRDRGYTSEQLSCLFGWIQMHHCFSNLGTFKNVLMPGRPTQTSWIRLSVLGSRYQRLKSSRISVRCSCVDSAWAPVVSAMEACSTLELSPMTLFFLQGAGKFYKEFQCHGRLVGWWLPLIGSPGSWNIHSLPTAEWHSKRWEVCSDLWKHQRVTSSMAL